MAHSANPRLVGLSTIILMAWSFDEPDGMSATCSKPSEGEAKAMVPTMGGTSSNPMSANAEALLERDLRRPAAVNRLVSIGFLVNCANGTMLR